EIVLTTGKTFVKNHRGRIDLALLLEPSLPALPYEAACNIDPATQRFVAGDEAAVELCRGDGESAPAPESSVAGALESGPTDMDDLVVDLGGQRVVLPVRYELPDEEDLPREAAGEYSAEHAILRFAASEGLRIEEIELPSL